MTSSGNGADRSSWQRIDDICDRFETEKRDGGDPQIGDFLEEATSPDERETLLRELLQLDIELSGELGQNVTLEKYLSQLPEHDQLIRTSFDRHQTRAHRRSSTSTSTEPQLTPGQEFGSYTIESKIGEGGMGHVYHARHVTMDRDVALKVLTPKLMDSPDAVARFHREIKAAAKLQHPNIVTAFDAGEQDGLHFLVMEFVDGRDLSSYVKSKGPLSLKQAIKSTMQAAKGLAYAHKQNIVHRDIKPANLLVDREGTVKVLDMGLARFEIESENHELTDLTGTGMVMGTIDYMAPEQSLDTKTADARSDIYSLGCTFWYLLTGKSVYGGDTVMKKLLAHREDEIPSLRELSAKVPESVDEVFHKLVAKDKDDRFQSMDEVIEALQGCLQGRKPSDSSSDMSMAADPKLANFLKDLDAPKATSPNMEYEDSKSHTAAEQATVIGEAGSSTRKPKPAAFSTGKWVYGVAAGIVALIVAALLIPGRNAPPKPKQQDDQVVSDDNVPTQPAKNEDEPDLPVGVTEDFSNAMTLEFDERDHVSFSTFPTGIQGPFTLEFWFIPIETPPDQGRTLLTMGDLSFIDVRVWTNRSTWRPSLVISDSERISQHQLTPSPWGKPNHFAIVVEEGRLDFYVNGFSQGQNFLESANGFSDNLPEFFNARADARGLYIGPVGKSAFDVPAGHLLELRVSNTARYDSDFTPQKRFSPDENTIALYHFDQGSGNTLRDYSGNGYHGVIEGAEWVRVDDELKVIEPEPEENYALEFDGKDDHVEIPTLKYDGTHPITIEATIRRGLKNGAIFGNLALKPARGLELRLLHESNENRLGAVQEARNPNELIRLSSNVNCELNRLHHIAGVFSGTEMRIYQNGILVGQKRLLPNQLPVVSDSEFYLGSNNFVDSVWFFDGIIDEVRISNVARYSEDFTPAKRFENDEHTLALYHFDEGSGDVLKDSSGNGHHGTIKGGEWVPLGESLTENTTDRWAAEREVAEWVIEQGGTVSTKNLTGGGTDQIAKIAELPEQPFFTRIIHLDQLSGLNSKELSRLSNLVGLDEVGLNQTSADEALIQYLGNSKRLRLLSLNATSIRSSMLSMLTPLKHLSGVQIGADQIDDNWRFLDYASRLREIYCYGYSFVHLKNLARYSHLRTLIIQESDDIDYEIIDELKANNPLLRVIVFGPDGKKVHGKDPWLEPIQKLKEFGVRIGGKLESGQEWDSFRDSPWDSDDFLRQTVTISFPVDYDYTKRDTEQFHQLNHYLVHLKAAGLQNADAFATELSQWSCINLSLDDSDLTDAGLQKLTEIPNLLSIGLNRSQVTREGVEQFRRERPLVRITSDFGEFPPVYPTDASRSPQE